MQEPPGMLNNTDASDTDHPKSSVTFTLRTTVEFEPVLYILVLFAGKKVVALSVPSTLYVFVAL